MDDQEFRQHVVGALGRIDGQLVGVNERLDGFHASIHGNGREGLAERVAKLEERTPPGSGVGTKGAVGISAIMGGLMTALLAYLSKVTGIEP